MDQPEVADEDEAGPGLGYEDVIVRGTMYR